MLFNVSFVLSIRALVIQTVDEVVFLSSHQSILVFLISEMIWQGEYETCQFPLYGDNEHFHL